MLGLTKKKIEKNFNIIVFCSIFLLITIYLFEVVTPFCIAFIIAYLTNPLKTYLDKHINETFSSFLCIIVFIFFLLSVLLLILPIILYQTNNLMLSLPGYFSEIENFFKEVNDKYLFTQKIKFFDYTSIFKPLTSNLINSGNSFLSRSIELISSFFNILLIIVISFYLSLEFNKIKNFIYSLAKKSKFTDFQPLLNEIDEVLSKFIRGQGLVCLILSIIYGMGLYSIGLKFGALLGIFAGIISFIPYVGSIMGGGLTIILGLLQFGISTELTLIFAIFLFGQLFESYFLTPKLVGNAIKLNPIWIIFALMTGAYLSGFVGVLISIPVAAVIGVVLRFYFKKLFK